MSVLLFIHILFIISAFFVCFQLSQDNVGQIKHRAQLFLNDTFNAGCMHVGCTGNIRIVIYTNISVSS